MGIICNKWPLDGSQKPFMELYYACLAYPGRAYEQSVLVRGLTYPPSSLPPPLSSPLDLPLSTWF